MILVVDIGNTNIVLGFVENDKILFTSRLITNVFKSEYSYTVEIEDIIKNYKIDINNIKGSIISSVVPPILKTIKNAIYKIILHMPVVVCNDIKPKLNILVDEVEKVGTDRIVNCIGALFYYKAPIIIFDMGTSTTISVIDNNSSFIGGCIIPGVKTSLDALSSKASQLPHINLEYPKHVIGKNTLECMKSGIINGTASMIDGMIDRIEIELNQKANIIITGGIAKFIVPYCNKKVEFDENLTLKGLNTIYKNTNWSC